MSKPTEESFLKDVSKHKMKILRDDGHNRHVRFHKPDSYNMSFDIVTWDGHLVYTGDMGTYVFSRIPDMFQFFRAKDTGPLEINTGYWSEKVLAQDRDGVREYSPDLFREKVTEHLESWIEDYIDNSDRYHGPDKPTAWLDDLREDVKDAVLNYAYDGEYAAMSAAINYRYYDHDGNNTKFEFTDFWETSCREYTFRFIWCCYAIVWGIREYDKQRS